MRYVRGRQNVEPGVGILWRTAGPVLSVRGVLRPARPVARGGDRTETKCHSLSAKACESAGVGPVVASLWFGGIGLTFAEEPPVAVLPDYPSVAEDRQRAAVELDRLAGLGKIHWYEEHSYPPDLRACSPHLVSEEGNVRVAHDWSSPMYPLNLVLTNPPVQYGAMDDFLQP